MSLKNGVSYYTTGTATIHVFFPEDQTVCRWCRFCRSDTPLNRYWCRLTGDMIYDPMTGRGVNCPIVLEGNDV